MAHAPRPADLNPQSAIRSQTMPTIDLGEYRCHVEIQGDGPVLLLVHGFPLDHTMWRPQFEELQQSVRLIAPDLRGFGRDDRPLPDTLTMQDFADDLAELLDALQVVSPVTFCGLSMGGYIGWQFWKRHRERVARLILCDTRATADSVEVARGRQMMANRVLQEGNAFVPAAMLDKLFSSATQQRDPQLIATTRDTILGTRPDAIAAAQRGMAERIDFQTDLPSINVPTLLLCGQDDVITPSVEMRVMAGSIPGSEFVEIPAAGHLPPLENPVATNRAIANFLR